MKIRTRLFLLFLPAAILTNICAASFFYDQWIRKKESSLEDFSSLPTPKSSSSFPRELTSRETSSKKKALPVAQNIQKKRSLEQWQKDLYLAKEKTPFLPKNPLFWAFLISFFSFLASVFGLFFAIRTVAKPVEKMKNRALNIASGNYGKKIPATGPKELQELSNIFNMMSECLHESTNRQRFLLQKETYSQKTCALLLQKLMFSMRKDDSLCDIVSIETVSIFADAKQGVLLDVVYHPQKPLQIFFLEAKKKGTSGMYDLLINHKTDLSRFSHIACVLEEKEETFTYHSQGLLPPFLWSFSHKRLSRMKKTTTKVQSGDFLFLHTPSLSKLYQTEEELQKHLAKVWKFFAEHGLQALAKMLQKEVSFFAKKQDFPEDIHFFFFQIL